VDACTVRYSQDLDPVRRLPSCLLTPLYLI